MCVAHLLCNLHDLPPEHGGLIVLMQESKGPGERRGLLVEDGLAGREEKHETDEWDGKRV